MKRDRSWKKRTSQRIGSDKKRVRDLREESGGDHMVGNVRG